MGRRNAESSAGFLLVAAVTALLLFEWTHCAADTSFPVRNNATFGVCEERLGECVVAGDLELEAETDSVFRRVLLSAQPVGTSGTEKSGMAFPCGYGERYTPNCFPHSQKPGYMPPKCGPLERSPECRKRPPY